MMLRPLEDICPEDCEGLVATFYGRARLDELLGPVFASRVPDDRWPEHFETMTRFWRTVLFGESSYRRNPLAKHAGLPITGEHFDRWVACWVATVDARFAGEIAERAKERARAMAVVLSSGGAPPVRLKRSGHGPTL